TELPDDLDYPVSTVEAAADCVDTVDLWSLRQSETVNSRAFACKALVDHRGK
nr:hypothetical protein [Tanacetum cinerariifolium]